MEVMVVESKKKAKSIVPLPEEVVRQRIAEKAYGFYLQRGQQDGDDLKDWFEAERLVLSEIGE